MKIIFAATAALTIALSGNALLAACDDGEMVIKLSHVTNTDKHPKGIAASLLQQRVNDEMTAKLVWKFTQIQHFIMIIRFWKQCYKVTYKWLHHRCQSLNSSRKFFVFLTFHLCSKTSMQLMNFKIPTLAKQ